jgi:serine/threonine-protein kinase
METVSEGTTRGSTPVVGEMVGPYRIVRQLGQGTTGRVFEVEHTRIGRRAAMKIVHRYGVVPAVVDRLFVEAQAVNLINHPHVVEISDILVPGEAQPDHALVMELLEGRSLADVLEADGPLPPARTLPIMAQVCAGLAAVHRAGFVHRDLKPENVFLIERAGSSDFVKLLDFGLVKALRGNIAAGTATVEGTFMGSPAYASPEQCAGQPVDERSDIYAVGVMLHELITGRLPFMSEHVADLLIKQINAPPPRLSDEHLATDIGRAFDAIIQACLIKDPAERVLSAAELADMFRRLAADDHALAGGLRGLRRPRGKRGRRAAFVIAPALALALAAVGVFAARPPRDRTPPLTASAVRPAAAVASAATPSAPTRNAMIDRTRDRATSPVDRRVARTPPRLSKAMTLDPYR